MRPRWFAHVDMDAFYASVELLDQPELQGLPIAVGGPADGRGVIAAASYPARRFGVRSAMPTAQALRLCPQLILLPGRMSRYQEKSREFMAILREVSPSVAALSLDEAFLDLTGCERLYGDWAEFGRRLRQRVLEETGLSASVGMGETRRIAKIASDLRKPAGMVVIERGHGAAFIQSLPIEKLWGVGPKFRERLRSHGLHTVADLAALSRAELQSRFGKSGLALHDMVHARENGSLRSSEAHKSIRHETTFSRDRIGLSQLEPTLIHLSEKVAARLRQNNLLGRVVQLKIRDRGFHTFTRRHTLPRPCDHESQIYQTAHRLLRDMDWENVPVRLLGVGVSQFSSNEARQADLFEDSKDRQEESLERAMDRVQERFGEDSIGRAHALMRGDNASWQRQLYPSRDQLPSVSSPGSLGDPASHGPERKHVPPLRGGEFDE
jgi:DNA polymerase-4